nr:MAG TPA: hypothetical protein [Caudoviricetes sp.]
MCFCTQLQRHFYYAHSSCMRPERAIFIPNFARHGVKLYSQSGCNPRKQSAGRKDTT